MAEGWSDKFDMCEGLSVLFLLVLRLRMQMRNA